MAIGLNFEQVNKRFSSERYVAECFDLKGNNGDQERKALLSTFYLLYNPFGNKMTGVFLPLENNGYNNTPKLIKYMIENLEKLSKEKKRKKGFEHIVPLTDDSKPFEDIFLKNGYNENGGNVLYKIYN